MPDPFIGDIRPWPHPVPPDGWLSCDGSLLQIEQFTVLSQLIGTDYGGDGHTTFGLPDLRGRFPVGYGSGPGLTFRQRASKFGTEQETLAVGQLPSHSHPMRAQSGPATTASPTNAYFAHDPEGAYAAAGDGTEVRLNGDSLKATGGSQPHTNMPPFQVLNFIIAAFGFFPPND